jgi:MFS family permease
MTVDERPRARAGHTSAPGVLSRPYRGVSLGALALVALGAFEAVAVTTTMPAVADALGGLALYGVAFGTPLATGIVGMVLAGSWADARGPAAPVRAGTALFTVGLLMAGFAPTMSVVVAGRAVQGFGSGLLGVAVYVVVGRCYPEQLRPRVFAGFAAAWLLPALVGPAISGLVAEHIGWRWVFLAAAVPAPLAALPVLGHLRAPTGSRRPARARRSVVDGRLPWAVGTGAAALLLHLAGQGSGAVTVVPAVIATLVLAVSARRLLPQGTFRASRGLPSVVALRGLAAAAFLGAEVFLPLVLVRERGLPPSTAGLVLTCGALGWAAGSWLQGRLAKPAQRAVLLRAGTMSLAVGIGNAVVTVLVHWPTALLVVGWAVAGLGMGIVVPVLSLLMLDLSAPGEEGANSSSLQIGEALATTVALAGGGALFAALIDRSPTTSYLAGLAIAGTAALGAALITSRAQGSPVIHPVRDRRRMR